MIEAKGLLKRFKDVQALGGVSFKVNDGEIVALLGPNGAGKTTTLRILAGVLRPDGGEALVDGKRPEEAKEQIGLLPTDAGFYVRLTPREVLSIFGRFWGLGREETERRVLELADRLKFRSYLDRRIGSLSTGMRQRVALALALVGDPKHLLLDEPARGLDVAAAAEMEEFLLELKEKGKAILLATHMTEQAEFLADRVVFLHRGEVKAQGTMEELRRLTGKTKLREIFLSLAND